MALLRAVTYLATCVESLDERSSERGPARLMRGAQAATRVAIEVLAKEDQVFPVGVSSITHFSAVTGPMPSLSGEKDSPAVV